MTHQILHEQTGTVIRISEFPAHRDLGFYSVFDVADLFGLSTDTIQKRCKQGKLPEPFKLGKCEYFHKAEILQAVNNQLSLTEEAVCKS